MNHLLKCPRCSKDGRSKYLGEVLENDVVKVQRQHSFNSYEDATLITGTDFTLICGYCRTPVYIRKEGENESSNVRRLWLHWVGVINGTLSQGISSGTDNASTFILTTGSR